MDAGLSPRSPSPLAGEGGPKGRVRGRAGLSDRPFNPSSVGLRPPPSPARGEGFRVRPPQVGAPLTSLGGCSVQDGTGWSRMALSL